MKSHFLAAGILLACASLTFPAAAQEIRSGVRTATPPSIDVATVSTAELAAMSRFQASYPGTLTYRKGLQLSRLYGRTFEMGDTPVMTADRFLNANADLFGAEAADLLPTTPIVPTGNTLPLMYDAETGTYKFTLIYHSQFRDGVPVFRSDIRLLVKNETGYPLVWVGSSLKRLGDFHPDTMLRSAVDPTAVAPAMVNFTAAEPVIWAGTDDNSAPPVQAVTFVADNLGTGADPQKWLYVVDAATGAVLLQENQILHTDVTGSVHGKATTLPKAAECNPEVDVAMPYAKVAIGSTTAYANASGNFTIPYGGTSLVTVTSYMSGQYFTVAAMTGSLETLTLSVTPPGPANFMHNSADTDPAIIAQVNAYVEANRVRDWVLTQNPSYPTIATQTNFALNVNYNLTCNAYYDGSSLNFYLAGGGCSNTAFSNVVHHEYGHHIVEMGGALQDQYGEGTGDAVAVCISDDPVLGYGFEGDCAAGIRTADNSMQYPCTSDIHTCAQLLSGCVWSTRNQLQATNPLGYLGILSSLMLNSVPMHAGSGTISPAIYTDWITLDGGISGPHYAEITAGFLAHNMLPQPVSDTCGGAITACPPNTYSGSTAGKTVDGSASCGSSSSTPDVWYKYRPATSGTLTLDLCSSSYNTVVSVHTGCPGTSSNQVGCNDDAGWFGPCGWFTTTPSYLEVSVTANTQYYIRVSGHSGATGDYSMTLSGPACAAGDTSSPTPNPMTFASAPAAASSSSITMTATTAADAESPPVQYYFNFVSGGAGGNDSAWQAGTSYTDSGLSPNTLYTYRVKARDSASPANETAYSTNAAATTLANAPSAPALSGATRTTLNLDVNANGNPAATQFAVQCTGTSPADAAWIGKYVSAAGAASATPVWRTDAQWAVTTVQGLQACTAYTFAVKARNTAMVETAFGPSASLGTTGHLGDMNGDGTVDGNDIQPFVTCAISGGSGCACANMTVSAFVNCLLNAGTCP
jgi:hypothetical protein